MRYSLMRNGPLCVRKESIVMTMFLMIGDKETTGTMWRMTLSIAW